MPACKNHPEKKEASLCMGCGSYFCEACGQEIHGVFYCKACETAAEEFVRAKEMESQYQPVGMSDEDVKWEQSFSSSRMVVIDRKNLEKIEKPLDLEPIVAGLSKRALAYMIDWMLAIPKLSFFFYYYVKVGTVRDFKFILTAEVLAAFFYFMFFNYTTGMTMGKLFADIRLVDAVGRQVSLGQAFGRALFAFMTLPFPFIAVILHGVVATMSATNRGMHDLLLATYVVKDDPWKEMAKTEIARRKNGD